jgi:lipopolysaccharide/colanic/teichoic acid biosynthesis glycosyltransferase
LIKRLFDLTVAVVGLIVLLPVFGLIGLAIRRDSP